MALRFLLRWTARALAMAAMAATISVVHAEPPCGDHRELVAHLAEKYQERQSCIMAAGDGWEATVTADLPGA